MSAEKSPTVATVGEPVAYMRRWAFDRNEGTRGNRPRGWKLHAITPGQCLPDDVPLYALEPRPEPGK